MVIGLIRAKNPNCTFWNNWTTCSQRRVGLGISVYTTKGKAVYSLLGLIIQLYLSKISASRKACDIVIPMHFYVHNKYLIIFVISFMQWNNCWHFKPHKFHLKVLYVIFKHEQIKSEGEFLITMNQCCDNLTQNYLLKLLTKMNDNGFTWPAESDKRHEWSFQAGLHVILTSKLANVYLSCLPKAFQMFRCVVGF